MPRFDLTDFGRLLARLTPHELQQAEGLVSEARERAAQVRQFASEFCAMGRGRRRSFKGLAVSDG